MRSTTTIEIDLAPPYRVNGRIVRFQSLWLLLRIYYAHHTDGAGVPASVVQARFPGSANLRMMMSRAFTDFANWGVAIGWGHDRSRPPALLNPMGRSRGPFWMDAADAARVRVRAKGSDVDMCALAQHLGLNPDELVKRDPVGYVMQDVTYWNHLTQAMRVAQDGFPIASDTNVAESFRAAQRSAQDNFQAALSVLKESLAWRKYGHLERSQEALKRLTRLLKPSGAGTSVPTFSAMAFVARGWNFYSRGEPIAAHAELDRLASDPQLHPVIRYNPRVRFEYLNLRALVHKTMAMNLKGLTDAERMHSATQAITDFSNALQAAYEADSIDAAQDVAANIGLTLWLCWKNGLIDPERERSEQAVQTQALRWLGLSEWICDRFGVGGRLCMEHDFPAADRPRPMPWGERHRPLPRAGAAGSATGTGRDASLSRAVFKGQGLYRLVRRCCFRPGRTRRRPHPLRAASTREPAAGIRLVLCIRKGIVQRSLFRRGTPRTAHGGTTAKGTALLQ